MKSLAVAAAALLGVAMMPPAAEARPFGFHGHHHGFRAHHHRFGGYRGIGVRGFHRVGYRRYGYHRYGYRRGFRPAAAAAGLGLGLAAAALRTAAYPGYYGPRRYYGSYRYGYAPVRYAYRPVAYGGYYRPVYRSYDGCGF